MSSTDTDAPARPSESARGEALRDSGKDSPLLDSHEQDQAAAHAAPKALVIHEVLREEGETELKRAGWALFWSGLGGGLSMGFSFLTLAFLQADLAGVPGGDVVASLGYSVGFVVVVLGRQQLFTETTLTATLPVLLRRTRESLVALMRMWAIVLVANLIGTVIFAWLIARAGLFAPPVENALGAIGLEIVSGDFWPKMFKAVLAGWLIALMVWTLPGAGSARLFVIILLTSAVSLGHFPHIVAGATDAAYALFSGRANLSDYAFGFLAPTLLGNTIGGVVLAAILNHAPVAHDIKSKGATAEA